MNPLTRIEEFILLSIYHLSDNAYGITIRQHIEQIMQKKFSVGAIYVPLERLENKGLITSYTGEATSERGGRRKRLYHLSSAGITALKETKRVHDTFWTNISDLEISRLGLS